MASGGSDQVTAAAVAMLAIFEGYKITEKTDWRKIALAQEIRDALGTPAARERFTSFEALGRFLDEKLVANLEIQGKKTSIHSFGGLGDTLNEMMQELARCSIAAEGVSGGLTPTTFLGRVREAVLGSSMDEAIRRRIKLLCPDYDKALEAMGRSLAPV